MTRTQRSTSPRAMLKDHALSRNGMDRHIPKGGAGPHNWGSLEKEWELEQAAEMDEQLESQGSEEGTGVNVVTNQDIDKARQARHHAVGKGADLTDIARTSAGAGTHADSLYISTTRDADTSVRESDKGGFV